MTALIMLKDALQGGALAVRVMRKRLVAVLSYLAFFFGTRSGRTK